MSIKSIRHQFANLLTFSRLFFAIIISIIYISECAYAFESILVLFIIAALTDYFDGLVARKLNISSNIGKCFDPIFDKLLVLTMILILADAHAVPIWISLIILAREVYVSGLREYLSGKKIQLHVSRLAKWKTCTQMTGIGFALFANCNNVYSWFLNCYECISIDSLGFFMAYEPSVAYILLVLSVILSTVTAIQYSKTAFEKLDH